MMKKALPPIENVGLDHLATCIGVDVYVPPFAKLARQAALLKNAMSQKTVTIPTELFRFLMATWLVRQHFDEIGYRTANPDVETALTAQELNSAKEHYVFTGYFEGRAPGWFPVDEQWYRAKYPDISVAERRGLVADPASHFNTTGRFEGRVASESQMHLKRKWDEVLGGEDGHLSLSESS
jgi:hypothetical protein